jgi:CRISPR-associated protein Csb3
MHELELPGDVRVALSHAAAYGLAVILEDAGASAVTLVWTASLNARAVVATADIDPVAAASIVQAHAAARSQPGCWLYAVSDVAGSRVGRLSPRIKAPVDDAGWLGLERERHETIDREVADRHWLDLSLIGALGEPAYWRRDQKGARRPDDGASRWEMKTRNRGEDFVQHRLRGLGAAVAARQPASVLAGLTGAVPPVDEVGRRADDSRTATGLASPGPVDNAQAWCAMWGLSLLPVARKLDRPSVTAGHTTAREPGESRRSWFHLPVVSRPLTVARLATILASEELPVAASASPNAEASESLAVRSARRWLLERGVGGVVRFPIGVFGSASAPERRALLGTVVRFVP